MGKRPNIHARLRPTARAEQQEQRLDGKRVQVRAAPLGEATRRRDTRVHSQPSHQTALLRPAAAEARPRRRNRAVVRTRRHQILLRRRGTEHGRARAERGWVVRAGGVVQRHAGEGSAFGGDGGVVVRRREGCGWDGFVDGVAGERELR